MPQRLGRGLLLAGSLGLLAACGGGAATEMQGFAAAPPTSAAGGFEVAQHGLAFPNYASQRGFTVGDAVEMFGDDAVCGPGEGTCVVDARAAAWIESVSASMAGGVCEGMVLFSLDRFVAGAAPVAASLSRDDRLEARIAQLFATQFLPGVGAATTSGDELGLEGVVERIEAGLAPGGDPVTIGVYDEGAGHALLPAAVERLDDGRVVVAVYDVNWPGGARVLELDLGADTWRYSIDAVDQAADPAAWRGGSAAIDLTPLSARADLGSGPFAVDAGRSVLTATFRGDGWSVTTASARVDADSVVPGQDGVLAVGRGARGATTVVIDASRPVTVASPVAVHLAAQTPAGWLTADSSAGTEVVVDGSTASLRVVRGELAGSTATASGEVEFPGRAGLEVSIEAAGVVLASEQWGRLVAEQPVGQRTDWIVTVDGSITADAPLQLPQSAREVDRSAGLSGPLSTPPLNSGTTATAPSTTTAAGVDAVGSTATSTVAPSTTSTSSAPSGSLPPTTAGAAPSTTSGAAPSTTALSPSTTGAPTPATTVAVPPTTGSPPTSPAPPPSPVTTAVAAP